MSIQVHIERLVLEGLPLDAAQGRVVQAAVAAELTRLLTERGLGANYRHCMAVERARGADIHLPPRPVPGMVGGQIGAAVHGSLVP